MDLLNETKTKNVLRQYKPWAHNLSKKLLNSGIGYTSNLLGSITMVHEFPSLPGSLPTCYYSRELEKEQYVKKEVLREGEIELEK